MAGSRLPNRRGALLAICALIWGLIMLCYICDLIFRRVWKETSKESYVEQISWTEKAGFVVAIKEISLQDDEAEILYELRYVRRDQVYLERGACIVRFVFYTREGEEIDGGWTQIYLDQAFRAGGDSYFRGLLNIPCDSQTVSLRVRLPKDAESLSITFDPTGHTTRPVRVTR